MSDLITCGCSCHEIDECDPDNVLMNGKKWTCLCALKETVHLLSKTKEEFNKATQKLEKLELDDRKYTSLKNDVENLICPNCFKKMGVDFVFVDGGVYCQKCIPELFPHYF